MPTLPDQTRDLLGVHLTAAQVAQFATLQTELVIWNTRMNLTGITAPDEVRERHFLDSLSVVKVLDLDSPKQVIDIGTGAGFPGLPLAITFPELQVTLVDSTGKKVRFVQHIIDKLGLPNANAIKARAEALGRDEAHREQYDVVLARSVARLPALLEYTLPLAKIGGAVVAMKGRTAQEEADDARRATIAFGGELAGIEPFTFPGQDRTHYLIHYRKANRTPGEFPREVGTPTRDPLT